MRGAAPPELRRGRGAPAFASRMAGLSAMVSFEYRDLLVAVWSDETPGFFRARAEEEFGRATPPGRIYLPFDDRWFVQYADNVEQLNPRELHYGGARLLASPSQ